MKYDPAFAPHRQFLAVELLCRLTEAGFTEEFRSGTKERMFSRTTPSGIRVVVFTSIVGTTMREAGDDAIRVCAVYKTKAGEDRGVGHADKRVNRVGVIKDIGDRMLNRMREVWTLIREIPRCSCCGAPQFMSKSKKWVCADLCWLTRQLAK